MFSFDWTPKINISHGSFKALPRWNARRFVSQSKSENKELFFSGFCEIVPRLNSERLQAHMHRRKCDIHRSDIIRKFLVKDEEPV